MGMSSRVVAAESADELWEIVLEALVAKAGGNVVDEEAVQDASTLLVAAMLMRHGVDEERVVDLFAERPYTIGLCWDGEAGEIGIEINWNPEGGDECWRCDTNQSTTEVGLCTPCLEVLQDHD